jgi:GNAT superfamily N-acetyltransferase
MSSHPELSPWLAGTLVHPARRGEGIGTALVQHAVARATELGVGTLYLYTEHARASTSDLAGATSRRSSTKARP